MQLGILATDGGPHPVDKWARMTAWMLVNKLIDIDEKSTSAQAVEMREVRDALQPKIYAVLKPFHARVQDGERGKIATTGTMRLSAPLHDAIAEHVDVAAIVDAVVAEAKLHPTVFAHYSKDETREAIRAQLVRDFASVMDIERSWRADGCRIVNGRAQPHPDHDPKCPHVRAYKERRDPKLDPSLAAA